MKLLPALCALFMVVLCPHAQADSKTAASQVSEKASSDEYGGPTGGVIVRYTSSKLRREWKIPGYFPEEPASGLLSATQIVDDGPTKFLVAYVWSGGNHCCWSILVFNIDSDKYLYEAIDSNTPLQVRPAEPDCSLVIRGRPYDDSIQVPKTATEQEIDDSMPYKDFCLSKGKVSVLRTLK
jgi:hypothetical protein